MAIDISKVRIFIRPGYMDVRKAINGLSVVETIQWNQIDYEKLFYNNVTIQSFMILFEKMKLHSIGNFYCDFRLNFPFCL